MFKSTLQKSFDLKNFHYEFHYTHYFYGRPNIVKLHIFIDNYKTNT